jgi:hypothetical protein
MPVFSFNASDSLLFEVLLFVIFIAFNKCWMFLLFCIALETPYTEAEVGGFETELFLPP